MSLFITFEGGEGCGKTVQSRALHRRLVRLAVPVLRTYEPGGTPLGRKLNRWLKWTDNLDISPLTELLLFNASRAQLVTREIVPHLESGAVVICDRFADSTTVYQGYGRGLELSMVEAVNQAATNGLTPDLTVLLDMPVEEGLARKGAGKQDRFEQEDIAFHRRVHEGYLNLAANEPQRWLVVDATQSKKIVEQVIWQRISRLLSQQGG